MTSDTSPAPRDTVFAFIHAINQHSIGQLTKLMAEKHTLVDSLGTAISGRDEVRNAWIGYFYLVPDFHISQTIVFENGNEFAVFGKAEGTCRIADSVDPSNHWSIPAAWRAVARDGQIVLWQIYADNDPVRKILEG